MSVVNTRSKYFHVFFLWHKIHQYHLLYYCSFYLFWKKWLLYLGFNIYTIFINLWTLSRCTKRLRIILVGHRADVLQWPKANGKILLEARVIITSRMAYKNTGSLHSIVTHIQVKQLLEWEIMRIVNFSFMVTLNILNMCLKIHY